MPASWLCRTALLGALGLACCNGPAASPAGRSETPASTTPAAVPAVPSGAASGLPATDRPALSTRSLAGVWRVIAADGGGESGFKGALMEIGEDQLSWSYRPADTMPGGDEVCRDAYIGPIEGKAGDTLLHARFARAAARLLPGFGLGHQPHLIDCRQSGRWGPGQVGTSYIYPVSDGRILMSWYWDSMLLMERLNRPQPPLPPENLPLEADDTQQ